MLSKKRTGRVTGSQAGAILGLCPWRSREDVMNDWLYGASFEGNVATEHGNFYEDYARADLELKLGIDIKENTNFIIDQDLDWLGATPDAIGDDFVVEIKCPYNMRKPKEGDEFKRIEDQPHYYAQVQIEMFCTKKDKCFFYQWSPTGISHLELVSKDQEWLDKNIPLLKQFLDEFKKRKLSLSDDEVLAQIYHIQKDKFEAAKFELDQIKEELIKKANGKKRKFGNVSVYPINRKGSVSYAKVVKEHLPDLDLSPYTGEPSTSWAVK